MTIRSGLPAWILAVLAAVTLAAQQSGPIGREVAIARHLRNGEELQLSLSQLVELGRAIFTANWTDQDGGGRPLSKGTGRPLTDPSQALSGPRAFNRLSGPDANSCQGCHVGPYQAAGGGGDFVANAFVMADRFDFVTFSPADAKPTRGAVDERGRAVTLQTVGNSRLTPGLWGAGYLEMLARQMTEDLRRIRDAIPPGGSRPLVAKGVSFGTLARRADGSWDVRRVDGLPRRSLTVAAAGARPSLLIYPWRQSGSVVSLRQMTNGELNQHHGIQSVERFGAGLDPDRDGVVDEATRGDVTAAVIWQATLPVPGRVIPRDAESERAIGAGERAFVTMGCASCHVPALPLERRGWIYSEPGPFNPPGNLRRGETKTVDVDLTDDSLPQPRLRRSGATPDTIAVPAYSDFKLHDITDPADPDAAEALDINEPPGSPRFAAGNRRFLTRRLWGAGNQGAYFHHGLITSLPQAILAHAGEALESRRAFERALKPERDALVAFLKSMQVLPPGTKGLVVDEHYQPRTP